MKRHYSTVILLAALAMLAACETTEGLGQDTTKLGNDISTSAYKHNPSTPPAQ